MKAYNKLVRDKIPEIIEKNNQVCEIEILPDEAYLAALDKKLNEECAEYLADKNIEELADILEVVYAIAQFKGVSIKELESLREQKAGERGGFSKRIFLKTVTD